VIAVMSTRDLGAVIEDDDIPLEDVSIFAHIRLTDEDVDRLRSAGLERMMVYRSGDESGHRHYLRLNPDGSCAALSPEHRCTIHPSRPTICRAFPFYFDLFAGLCMVEACPGVGGEPQPLSALQEEIRAAATMYEFWLKDMRGRWIKER
jgi:Fe-S-cluster containining protein